MKRFAASVAALLACAAVLLGPGAAQASADVYLGTNVYRIPTTERVCALTFDDWYTATYLTRVLATLQSTGADGTFFPTGSCVDNSPWLTAQIEAAGYDIASHSYSHAWMTKLTTSGMISQLQRTENALASLGIKDPAPLFRAPFGAWNSKMLSVLRGEGYVNIMWSATAGDTAAGGRTGSQVVSMVMSQLQPGAIILMHISQKSTPDALPELIRQIRARGYRIVNLREALFTPEQREARYQQICPQLYYMGNWGRWSTQYASGGSVYVAGGSGPAVLGSFTGTTFEILAATGPGYGELSVAIDDGTPAIVDLYSWSTLYRRRVFRVTELTDTTHTVLIRSNNTKNPASYGYSVSLDAFKVSGELLQAPQPTRYQQDDLAFSFRGPWTTVANTSCSGGSIAYTDLPGSAVKVEFTGTYMAWIGKKGPGYGQARVSLDDGTPVIVDLYSSYDAYKQRIYNTGRLTDGPHTVSIQWLGSKNPASYGYRVAVDAFDFFATPTAAGEPEPLLWRYQQTDPRLTYLGTWSTNSTWSSSGGSYASTGGAGAVALCHFDGTSVSLLAKTAPWYGKALITLDGDDAGAETVDFYSAVSAYKQVLYAKEGLTPGPHTLVVKCLGEKNDSSSGVSISLDALDIDGFMTPAPALVRYQQDDPALDYLGTWSTASTWSASGGSYKTCNEIGGQVTVEFTGSYLGWLAKTAPWYGQAKVSLYDGAVDPANLVSSTTVDLYSATQVFKKRAYHTGLLADGPHTLVIEWTGEKNPASSGTGISVDAFDMVGAF